MKKIILTLGLMGLTVSTAWSVPQVLNFQGRLLESGAPVNGSRAVTFMIYVSQTGGSALFTETQTVALSSGIFNALIGEGTPGGIPLMVFDGNDRYVEVKVGPSTLPRQRMASISHAFFAERARSLIDGGIVHASSITVSNISISTMVATTILGNNAAFSGELTVGNGTIHLQGVVGGQLANAITITQLAGQNTPQLRTSAGLPANTSSLAATGATPLIINTGASGRLDINPFSSGGIFIGNPVTSSITLNAGIGPITTPSNIVFSGLTPLISSTLGPLSINSAGAASLNPASVGNVLLANGGGNVGIGTLTPATRLDVNGSAQFGSGATKSTFTATGSLLLANNANLALSGPAGTITSASSITASAFFGDGSGLTGIFASDPTKVAKVGDTMTGQLTITGSSLTVSGAVGIGVIGASNGTLVVQSTSTTPGNPVTNIRNNAGTSLMQVQQGGNVGIGTTAPHAKLDVNGVIQVGTFTSDPLPQDSFEGEFYYNTLSHTFRAFKCQPPAWTNLETPCITVATKLAFAVQPSNAAAGISISPAVQVAIQDASANTVTASNASVTVAIGANPGGGTLAGGTMVAAVNGVATFSNLSINNPGTGYTLTASATGLAGAVSSAFNINAPVCSPTCQNGGTCTAPNTCSCPAAWTGPTCGIAVGSVGAWITQTSNPLPFAIHSHTMMAWNDRLYVTGGIGGTDGVQSKVHFAPINPDGSVGTWATQTDHPLPVPLPQHAMSIWNDRIYVTGGNSFGGPAQPPVYVAPINPDGSVGAWSTQTANFLPEARSRHAMSAWNGRLYVTGGGNSNGFPQSTVYVAPINPDGSVGAWITQTTNPLPQGLSDHAMSVWNGRLYVTGGVSGSPSFVDQTTVYVAPINPDGSVGAWTTQTTNPFPQARSAHTMSAWNGKLYVTGGPIYPPQSTVYVAPINPDGSVGAWTTQTSNPLPQALSEHAMSVWNGRLYVTGGFDGSFNQSAVYVAPTN